MYCTEQLCLTLWQLDTCIHHVRSFSVLFPLFHSLSLPPADAAPYVPYIATVQLRSSPGWNDINIRGMLLLHLLLRGSAKTILHHSAATLLRSKQLTDLLLLTQMLNKPSVCLKSEEIMSASRSECFFLVVTSALNTLQHYSLGRLFHSNLRGIVRSFYLLSNSGLCLQRYFLISQMCPVCLE